MELRYTLGSLAFALAAPLVAQPTLNLANNLPAEGLFEVTTATDWASEGPAGADVTFTLWNLISNNTHRNYFVHQAGFTPSSATIPTANMLTTDGGTDTLFWNYAADGLYQVGVRSGLEGLANFSDPVLELKYPCTFGTTWSDITLASYNSPLGAVSRTGTITGVADAYGSLGMSEVYLDDVLRVKVRRDFTDVAALATVRRITNTWYYFTEDEAWPQVKLVVDSASINGGGYTVTRSAQWMGGVGGVGVGEINADEVLFTPYPNPTAGIVDLGLGMAEVRSVEVFTAAGQLVTSEVKPISATRSSAIDLTGMPAGVYHVKVTATDHRTASRRVVVQ